MRISSGVSAVVDVTDRVARELGLVDLQTVAGGFQQDLTRQLGRVDLAINGGLLLFDSRGADGGAATNAGAGNIFATTGNQPAGLYEVRYFLGGSAADANFRLRWRDSADVLKEDLIFLTAVGMIGGLMTIPFALNDEVLVITIAAQVGTYGAGLSWRRLLV